MSKCIVYKFLHDCGLELSDLVILHVVAKSTQLKYNKYPLKRISYQSEKLGPIPHLTGSDVYRHMHN